MNQGKSIVVAMLCPLPARLVDALGAAGHRAVHAYGEADAEALAQAEVVITRGSIPVGAETFDRFPALRLVCCWGAGYDAVDLAEAHRRGIQVANSPGMNSSGVADFGIGLVVAIMRRMPEAQRHLRGGHWKDAAVRLPAPRGLTGARLGLFGYGEIGRRIAARARALEMEVGCFTRRPPDEPGLATFRDLVSLAQWSDVLVVAVGSTPETRHAVNAAVLEALGPDGHLVNISRGAVVDEQALCNALRAGRLSGFASDVFEHEPVVPQAMLDFPNAVLTPHVGGATVQGQLAMVDAVCGNIRAFLDTGSALHPVGLPRA